ncbi:phosphopantetheine-binding protein [Frankia sp. AgB32]|uniref:phosphopantetheine-binding protein n=1 Tax=Frankia sp. AgB32 TaxID=631119 RepID=UPI00200DC593|nr:phosphopantetheine-binding protein [Frankia sp. AgB32]MCK9893747.1 phosphopantetheine-binding protein [Frankia sp. AgB32]
MPSQDAVRNLVAKVTGIDPEQLSDSARFGAELGFDSFVLLELHAGLADLGIELTERDWLAIDSIAELHQACQSQEPEGVAHLDPATNRGAQDWPRASSLAPPHDALHLDPQRETDKLDVATGSAEPPTWNGKLFRLTPVLPTSTAFLYELAIAPDVGFRWRYRGSVPNVHQFEQELWASTLSQFVVESVESGEPVGNVICYNPDFTLGHAYVGAAMINRYRGSGIALEPVQLFIRYLFDVWPFRKLYFEIPEFNFKQFASAQSEHFQIEARLKDHDYYGGRYWDRLILAVRRRQPLTVGFSPSADAGRIGVAEQVAPFHGPR